MTKSLYDITDEEADPKYNIGEEHERLLVELSKLHDLCKQVSKKPHLLRIFFNFLYLERHIYCTLAPKHMWT